MSETQNDQQTRSEQRIWIGDKGSVLIEWQATGVDSVSLLKAAIRKLYGEESPVARRPR